MRDRPLFVTSNPGKVREVAALLGRPVEPLDVDLPEIQSLDVAIVAREKAIAAYRLAARPVFVEDTGLTIEALGGLPGALVRWFLLTVGPAGICALLPDGQPRNAVARTAIALCDETGVEVYLGETRGTITAEPVGSGGFGWDAIFRPDGSDLTFAQMGQDERNRYSMRHRAIEQVRDRLIARER